METNWIEIVGYLFLWTATMIGRKDDSELKFFKPNWWIVLVFVVVGVEIIKNS